ncbi:MAG TPA: hypothetical protein VN812_09080 [Candidatus Acidoferrales bacterium]|nr:hypothetical protein [Candidatus Acidoferrales bacterium]
MSKAVPAGRPDTRAIGTARSVLGRVDAQLSAVDLLAVESLDGFRRLRLAGELDEGKPTRPTGFAICTEVDVGDLPCRREGVCQLLLSRPEIEIADEYLGRNGWTPLCERVLYVHLRVFRPS